MMKKRWSALLLALMLIVCQAFTGVAMAADSDVSYRLTVENAGTRTAPAVEIKLAISGGATSAWLSGFEFTMSYDSSKVTLSSLDKAETIGNSLGYTFVSGNKIRWAASPTAASNLTVGTTSVTLAKATFDAVSDGTAEISVTDCKIVTGESTKYATTSVTPCTIAIGAVAKLPQAPLTINDTALFVGKQATLSTSGGSSKGNVTWAVTNNTGRASINSTTGQITPQREGVVSVTATKAGDEEYAAATATANLTIHPAGDAKNSYTFSVLANATSSVNVNTGSTITVTLRLACDDASTYDLYSFRDFVEFDPQYLTFVNDSLTVTPLTGTTDQIEAVYQENNHRVYVNRFALSGGAVSMSTDTALVTFQLNVQQQTGTTTLKHANAEVLEGMDTRLVSTNNATITITAGGGTDTTGGGSGTSTRTPGNTDTSTPGTTKTTVTATETTKGSGDYAYTVDATTGKTLTDGVTSGNSNVVIEATTGTPANSASVTIPASIAQELVKAGATGLTVTSAVGNVTITGEGLAELAKSGAVVITLNSPVGSSSATVTITAGGKTVTDVKGGVKVSLPNITSTADDAALGTSDPSAIIKFSTVTATGSKTLLNGSATVVLQTGLGVSFPDTNGRWMDSYVQFVTARGIMEGGDDGNFSPEAKMTRSQIAQVLYNIVGKPSVQSSAAFADVESSRWYAPAAAWAKEAGIMTGDDTGAFNADAAVTRESVAKMFDSFAQYMGLTTGSNGSLAGFADQGDVGGWAADSMKWAVSVGLFEGSINAETGARELNPKGELTRAEMAKLLTSFVELVLE